MTPNSVTALEDRYARIFADHPSVRLIIDVDSGEIVDANQAAEEFYRYAPGVLCGKTLFDINTLPETELREQLHVAYENRVKTYAAMHRLADDSLKFVEAQTMPFIEAGRRLLFVVVHDVDEHIRNKRALTERDRRWKLLFDKMAEAVLLVDCGDDLVIDCNEAAGLLWGAQTAELRGSKTADLMLFDVCHIEDGAASSLNPCLLAGECDALARTPHGDIPVLVSTSHLELDGRNMALCLFRDMTEHKRLENLKFDVEAMTRHDLKSPLTGVLGALGVIIEECGDNPLVVDMAKAAVQSARGALSVLDESLDLLRIESGAMGFHPQAVDLAALIDDEIERLFVQAASKRVDFAFDAPRAAKPGTAGRSLILGEPSLARSIVHNTL